MKIPVKKRLFWYLKDGVEFNLESPRDVDLYVQQVLSRGKTEDVKKMMRDLKPDVFKKSFERIKRFLPKEVRMFWEDGLGDSG